MKATTQLSFLLVGLIACTFCSALAGPRPGFSIGTDVNKNDIADNGLVRFNWAVGSGNEIWYDPFIIYMWINSTELTAPGVPMPLGPMNQTFTIEAHSDADEVTVTPSVLNGNVLEPVVGPNTQVEFILKCTAKKTVTANITLIIMLDPPSLYNALAIHIEKHCIPVVPIYPNAGPRPGFSIGSQANHSDIANNGLISPNWSGQGDQVWYDPFLIFMWINLTQVNPPGIPGPLAPANQTFSIVTESDAAEVTVTAGTSKGNVVEPVNGPNTLVEFILVCTAKKTVFANITITVNLDPPESYMPIQIHMTKYCTPLVIPGLGPGGNSNGGWSGFGIFCFVVFILVTVSCLCGCAFNYQQMSKTGMDIIPGITYYRQFFNWVLGKPKGVGPQYDTEGGSGGYGSYQSNL